MSDSVKVAEKAADDADKELKASDKDAEKAAEKSHNAVNRYRCEIVTVSKQDATFEKHMSQKHRFIEQIDGNVSQQSIEEQPKTLPQDRFCKPQKGSDEYRILVAENFKLLHEEIEKYPPIKEKLRNEFKAKPDMFISWYDLVNRDAIKKNDANLDSKLEEFLDSKLEEFKTRLSKNGKQMK